MIMLAFSSSPPPTDSAYSSPTCSYVFADSVRKAPLKRRISSVKDASTQTEPEHRNLRRIAYRLAFLCDEFEKEFSPDSEVYPGSSSSFTDLLWRWIR